MSNRSKNTAERRARVLTMLAETANVTLAARRAGVNRQTLYEWRDADPDFAEAWKIAVERGLDALEDEAMRRAMQGTPRPVFHNGRRCGEVWHFSDALLMFLLRCRRPEVYAHASHPIWKRDREPGPVIVEIVQFPDIEEEEENGGLQRNTANGVTGTGHGRWNAETAAPGARGLADRLRVGTCLATAAER